MFRGDADPARSRLRDADGRIVAVTQRRFVSMRDPHLGCARDDARRRELVGPARGPERARRHRAQRRRRAVRGAAPTQHLDAAAAPTARTTRWSVSSSRRTSRTSGSRRRPARGCTATARRLAVEPELVEREGYVALAVRRSTSSAGDETVVEKIVVDLHLARQGISEPGEEACDWRDAALPATSTTCSSATS